MAVVREVYDLPPDHRWTARRGHKILALERGAVVFEFPVWDGVLGSLRLGAPVDDPTRGRRIE